MRPPSSPNRSIKSFNGRLSRAFAPNACELGNEMYVNAVPAFVVYT